MEKPNAERDWSREKNIYSEVKIFVIWGSQQFIIINFGCGYLPADKDRSDTESCLFHLPFGEAGWGYYNLVAFIIFKKIIRQLAPFLP